MEKMASIVRGVGFAAALFLLPTVGSSQDIAVYGGLDVSSGANIPIPDGSNSVSRLVGTDFGTVNIATDSGFGEFYIFNEDNDTPLNIISASIVGDASFEITGTATSPVAPGELTAISIIFDPSTAGEKNATVQIVSNDPDGGESTYTFAIQGTGVAGFPLVSPDLGVEVGKFKVKLKNNLVTLSGKVNYSNQSDFDSDSPAIKVYVSEDRYLSDDDDLLQTIIGKPLKAASSASAKVKTTFASPRFGYLFFVIESQPPSDDEPGYRNNIAKLRFGVVEPQ